MKFSLTHKRLYRMGFSKGVILPAEFTKGKEEVCLIYNKDIVVVLDTNAPKELVDRVTKLFSD